MSAANTMLTPSFDEWYEEFKPQHNPNNDGFGFSDGDTFPQYAVNGSDLQTVQGVFEKEPSRVWTVIDVDGNTYIVNGMAYVNREAYIITEKPAPENTDFEVLEYEDDANMYARQLEEGTLKTIYQVKPEHRTEDMDENDVFGDLDDAKAYFDEVPEDGWLTIDCTDGCPIENPCFVA